MQKRWGGVSERIVQWIRKQVESANAKGLIVGLSGGVDSSVTVVLSKKAFPETTLGLVLPCFSNPEDLEHARLVADKFDIPTKTVELTPVFESLYERLEGEPYNLSKQSMAIANIKPRLRMMTLYYFANKMNYLVAGASNRSEITVGYFTKYGDSGVDILPIGGLLKTEVIELARNLSIPKPIIEKPPSAGLWEGQTDEEEMGITYEQLDAFLSVGKGDPDIINIIQSMIKKSEHKRRTPPRPTF